MGVVWRSDSTRSGGGKRVPPPSKAGNKSRDGRRLARRMGWLLVVSLVAGGGYAAWHEMHSSKLQALWLSRYADNLDYQLKPGVSPSIHFPEAGPFDRRLGYAQLPNFLERLARSGFTVEEQVHFSPALQRYVSHGFFVPYAEKFQAGLSIYDCRGEPLYHNRYPHQYYEAFEDVPPLVAMSLLFIEDRGLLDTGRPLANPAVDWPRFTRAAITQVERHLGLSGQTAGGSTLATQVEKYRHSPEGRTGSAEEKFRQMISASVRAYSQGQLTLEARQQIVRDYLNSVPLSAAYGHGEVHGIADGLRLWFGADFAEVNRLLDSRRNAVAPLDAQALALRQVLSLLIAQRRPSYYLISGRDELAKLTDSHLRLLASGGVIDSGLRDAALKQQVVFRDLRSEPGIREVAADKGISAARMRLSNLLGVSLYELDRLDLSATTPLHGELQQQVSEYLARLADPAFAGEVGLLGERMLSAERTADVRYSFTLFERGEQGFRVRVQTDNTNQPFDINEGSKLELGSTAKLRVLTTYLEIIAELYERYAPLSRDELSQVEADEPLTRWALAYLGRTPEPSLSGMLEAALERRYSASPGERFFTGAGMHSFGNFRREDNNRLPTLREALQESINLPFVRLMRDVVSYSTYQVGNGAELLKSDDNPQRAEYLRRFADREGSVFLMRFWRKYQNKSADERIEVLLDGIRPTPSRLAAVHRYLFPDAERASFERFLRTRLTDVDLSDVDIDLLHERYAPGSFSLPDQGYIARVHPLDLWLLGYLIRNPDAGIFEAIAASAEQRQEVYGWLFRSRHKSARDSRIRIMLEVEAFTDIHRRWQRLGYPFEHLVPSLATALGSSGDRPAALAELMGIIVNDGVRLPSVRIDSLHFASDTPYETRLGISPYGGERVMPSEVAAALRSALQSVVEQGTGRRLRGIFVQADGEPLRVGGKTGTGDNRIQTIGAGGRLISSTAMNRTATFVFYLGPDHFGTLTAYVPGRKADNFSFTSALPVQVLKGMAPILQPYLESPGQICQPPAEPVAPTLTAGTDSAKP
ncbi:transglycosylase domain-containing protein [Stutzerimonas stutzeri]|uniref:transglycosylase domain-containing protein n=1 Tax=Stutzerimonas stutzeri TaxID=316 RepID=UPI00265A1E28|nr:transglycosylase domain-containing protein [Stutzerimonas stutzeri]MCF6781846.1 transglycosylase domain-containing protein [Stutzerimonas stutzeri]MCF6803904.1 transglycosylase domain-containing protein [Stutzerimonas stutzeri]